MKALGLVIKAKGYFPQAYRTTPPFTFNKTAAGVASCTSWMRQQCAVPANESTQVYPAIGGTPNVTIGKIAIAMPGFARRRPDLAIEEVDVVSALSDTARDK